MWDLIIYIDYNTKKMILAKMINGKLYILQFEWITIAQIEQKCL